MKIDDMKLDELEASNSAKIEQIFVLVTGLRESHDALLEAAKEVLVGNRDYDGFAKLRAAITKAEALP